MSETEVGGRSECPSCGGAFDTERAMKIHHKKKHNESLAGVTVTCDQCGQEIRGRKSSKTEGRNYCSKECFYNHRSQLQDNNVQVECEFCNTQYRVPPHKEKVTKFCSRECKGKNLAKVENPKEHVELECESCGDGFQIPPSHNEQRVYCSNGCRYEAFQDRFSGQSNPRWKGGVADYGDNWREQRKAALDRDNYRCTRCDMTNTKHREKYNQSLHVHHIEPVRLFENHEKANKLSNLITLCQLCHNRLEGLPIDMSGTPDQRKATKEQTGQ